MHHAHFEQHVGASRAQCWQFFSTANNLKELTPAHLSFRQSDTYDAPIYSGQIIIHRIKPFFGVPIEWVTEITHVQELDYFVDEQRFGPFKFWHHEHRFLDNGDGCTLTDSLHYQLHGGIIGTAINRLVVARSVADIFNYRRQKIAELLK